MPAEKPPSEEKTNSSTDHEAEGTTLESPKETTLESVVCLPGSDFPRRTSRTSSDESLQIVEGASRFSSLSCASTSSSSSGATSGTDNPVLLRHESFGHLR